MRDHEAAMKVYVQLAVVSHQKHQPQVRDRFLLLAGVEACRAGWPEVADCCRLKLVAANPSHMASHFLTLADALRDSEFQAIVTHWERYCPFEKAEAMIRGVQDPLTPTPDVSVGEQMLQWLGSLST